MGRLQERLKELRGTLSYFDVEKGTGINRGQLRQYEIGELQPTPMMLRKLAEYYDISYEELRFLWLEDFFSEPEERAIVLKWAKQHLMDDN